MGFGEEDHGGKVPFSSYHIKVAHCHCDVTFDFDLEYLAEIVFGKLSPT
jgi:hypothetical protein